MAALQVKHATRIFSRCKVNYFQSNVVFNYLRQCSSFDINSIVKLNRNSGKSGAKASKVAKTKSTKVVSADSANESSIETENANSSETTAQTQQKNAKLKKKRENLIADNPECFTVILDCPLYKGSELDRAKHAEFKDLIEDLEISYTPSVSSIIKKTEPKAQQEVLRQWREAKVEELGGVAQFNAYQKDTLDAGLNLHKCIELSFKGITDFTVDPRSEGFWESVQSALGEVSGVKLQEMEIVHPEMFYAGKFDCLATIRDTLCLIEWKTSTKPKPLLSATYDAPLQLAAYIGAVNRSGILKSHGIDNISNGALVFAYPSGEPATVHMMSNKICEKYWQRWQERLYQYWAGRYYEHADRVE